MTLAPLRLPSTSWKLLLQLPLLPAALTPWWCLLHECVANASKFYSWKNSLGCLFPETVFHLFVEYPFKWQYQTQVLTFSDSTEIFSTALSVWTALFSFINAFNSPCLHSLGLGFSLTGSMKILWSTCFRSVAMGSRDVFSKFSQ